MALRLVAAVTLSALPVLLVTTSALAQPPPAKPGEKKPDAVFDPDAKPKEPPPLPPAEAGQWGVGGKEEEGKFAPSAAKKKQEEEERAKKQKEEEKPVDLGPPRFAWIDTVIGFGSMREVTNDTERTTTTGASFVFGFRWRIAEIWTLFARFPFTRASTNGPAGPFNTFAVGNLELGVQPSFKVSRSLRIPAQLSVFFPTAQGDLFPDMAAADQQVSIAQAQMNQAASYARGWEEVPLFATRRFGLRLGGGITYDTEAGPGTIHVTAGTRFDVMPKVGGGDAYPGYTLSGTSFVWTTYASFHYGFFDGKLEPGLRAWLAYAKLPIHSNTRDYSGPQFVLEPQVNGRFPVNADKTMAVRAGIGVILPVSGPLGGANAPFDASIKGFRINAGFEF